MSDVMPPDWMFDDPETLDPEAREIPLRLTKDELFTASERGIRRHGWRFEDMEDDR